MGLYKRILEERMGSSRGRVTSNNGPFEIDIKEEGITERYLRANYAAERMDAFNASVTDWANRVTSQLKGNISTAGIQGKMLGSSIKPNFKKDYGEIIRIGFKFHRYGVFVHKGVGRGYHMAGSGTMRTAKSETEKERKPKPWFNPVVERNLPALRDIVVDYTKDAIINTTRIFIR
jgi:hypothetical protein